MSVWIFLLIMMLFLLLHYIVTCICVLEERFSGESQVFAFVLAKRAAE